MKNRELFEKMMRSVDDVYLEEAMDTKKKRKQPWYLAVMAACLCVVCGAVLALQGGPDGGDTTVVNPVSSATQEEIRAIGYPVALAPEAELLGCNLIALGENYELPMAELVFSLEETEYTLRALKTTADDDISGLYYDWDEERQWSSGGVDMKLCHGGENNGYVDWYTEEDGIKWCLSAVTETERLVEAAEKMARDLGHTGKTLPETAQEVETTSVEADGITLAQTTFLWNGMEFVYRTANTNDFTDISGLEDAFSRTATAKVGWNEAQLFYDEGGAGKILWYDYAPGLMYSLTVVEGADEEVLTEMARQVYEPLQNDVE